MEPTVHSLDNRVTNLEGKVERVEQTIMKIKGDTGQLVDWYRGGRMLTIAFRWAVVVAAAIATMYAAFHGKIL